MQPKRHIGDVIWRTQVRRIIQEHLFVLEGLRDIDKCFEHVVHPILVREALELEYPLDILRLSLASYRWPRRLIGVLNMISDFILATRGVIAGSAFAVFELICMMVRAMRRISAAWPTASLSVHVDDFCT